MKIRDYSELTEKEVDAMANKCIDAAIQYAKDNNLSGLSCNGSHNIYKAIQDALSAEWENAKDSKRRRT
jgi:hypothetical protein